MNVVSVYSQSWIVSVDSGMVLSCPMQPFRVRFAQFGLGKF